MRRGIEFAEFLNPMRNHLHSKVLETIRRHRMIRPGDRLGLGVSGGADSVAMLRVFDELRAELGVHLFVLHFHHQLRGAEADEDERFVQTLAAEFRCEFRSARADVAAEAKLHRWNIEDAGRRLRYSFFASVAKSLALERVAVAHTENDQAETVLAHLLRGSGLTGLAGIAPVSGAIIRPLLHARREDLREYLSALGQGWREDATNQDAALTRARIRHQLIPLLVRDFDPAVVTRLARLASHAREDEAFWSALEGERFRGLVQREPSGGMSVGAADLLSPVSSLAPSLREDESQPAFAGDAALALSRRLVRRIFAELRGSRAQLTSGHVDSVIDLAAHAQSGASLDLPGIRVERIFGRLVFSDATGVRRNRGALVEPANGSDFSYVVARPDPLESASIVVTEIHRRISLKMVDWPSARSDTVTARGALDFERVQWPLILRNWRPGDSYRPHGSRRVRKLKRLFLESRVPRSARAGWPVLTSAGKVIWASGYPAAEGLAPDSGTRVGLVIGEEELSIGGNTPKQLPRERF